MSQTLLEMAKDLVQAQIRAFKLSPEDMHETLNAIHDCLLGLHAREAYGQGAGEMPSRPPAPPNWRKSITKHFVRCLVCGASAKQLTLRHLKTHGLDARSYRIRFKIPLRQPLAARAVTAHRKQLALRLRPWEKAPMYLKKQETAKQAAVKKARLRKTHESETARAVVPPKRASRKRTTP
jgi:predicted transcriptional regulator